MVLLSVQAELRRQQEEDEQREVQRKESIRLHEQQMTEVAGYLYQGHFPTIRLHEHQMT